ncbi:MAG TPA: PP2C family protein-serine/threonine phosphatase [Terriglobia bacterium]|nr:PP2C family protein-serine/threonine phosphatase [Terriglobia bacterium]
MQTPSPSETLAGVQERLPLEQQVARLQALLEATRQVHSTMRVNDVLTQAARILVRELEMDGALFVSPASPEPLVSYGQVPSAPHAGCHRFPLLSRDHHLLAELIVAPPEQAVFSLYEQDFVEGLALQTAVALENATLHERDLEWARVQQDLNAARSLQQSLLPAAMPEIPGYSVAARSTTCYEVGGDYLDSVAMPDGSHLMVVADVAGKGLASAIVATSFRSALRSLAGQGLPLEEMAARMGRQHWEEGNEARCRYVTALFLRLKPDSGEIEIVNAGHNPPALVLPDDSVVMIEASGTPLGMLPEMSYAAETFLFPAGSRILLYTDGLTEVFREEEEFGSERLVALFRDAPVAHSGLILKSLWETLASFSLNAPQTDDMTALAIYHLDHATRAESARAVDSSQQEFVHP